jgi:hypothetical protein
MKPYTFYFDVYGKVLRTTVEAHCYDDGVISARKKLEKLLVKNLKLIAQPNEVPQPEQPDTDIVTPKNMSLDDMKRFFGMT